MMTYPARYIEGINLFNQGHYWHAHECWEECWLGSTEPDNTFYRGIIQSAAALYHWNKHNLRGLNLNWRKSRAKLIQLPHVYKGLDLDRFIVAMDEFVSQHHAEGEAEIPQLCFSGKDSCSSGGRSSCCDGGS